METKRPDIEAEKLGVPPEPPPGPPRRLLKDGEIPRRPGDGHQPSTSTTDPKNPPSDESGVPRMPTPSEYEEKLKTFTGSTKVIGPLDRIADSMERVVTLLEEIHAAIQPQEEADEVLDPSAGLVTVRATTWAGVARCYVVRTESTSAAMDAACSAWECKWADLVQKSVEMEEYGI